MWTMEVEGGLPRAVKEYVQVERALRRLTPLGRKTFAILDSGRGSYLQVAGGQVSCVVELNRAPDASEPGRWRAVLEVPHGNYKVAVTKHFGAGTLLVQPDEVLWIDDVVAVFGEFFGGQDFPGFVRWRRMPGLAPLETGQALKH